MERKAIWKWLVLAVLVISSAMVIYPPRQKIKLGLDLSGGVSFVVEVDREEIKKKLLEADPNMAPEALSAAVARESARAGDNALEVIRNRVDGLGIAEPIIYSSSYEGHARIVVQLPGVGEEKIKEAREAIQSVAFLEFRLVQEKSAEWVSALLAAGKAPRGFKVSEQGDYYVRDRDAVKDEAMDQTYWANLRRFESKPGCEFMLEKSTDNAGRTIYHPYYVEVRRQLTGETLRDARVDYHQMTHAPEVSIEFDKAGARKFAAVTRNYAPHGPKNQESNTGRQLAIILDGTLYSAPVIREEIPTGKAVISGHFKVAEAMRLANVLRAGSLPVPVTIVETRTVDPSLGRDAIDGGARAAIIGSLAVVIFMLVYYMWGGLVADIALALNLILLPLGMVFVAGIFNTLDQSGVSSGGISLPTITLPGIAGIVLMLGMAVDANVLIFERMREEQKLGRRFSAIIGAGYEKAFSAIFDSNATTILAAVIMFIFGSGPVRGYAITLTAGLLVSMYTAIMVTRMIFDRLDRNGHMTELKMRQWIKETKVDFIGKRHIALLLTLAIIVVSVGVFAFRGKNNFNIDFTGGAVNTFQFTKKQPTEVVRNALESIGIADPFIQYQKDFKVGGKEYLEVKTSFAESEKVVQTLTSHFSDYQLVKQDNVGPQVGRELQSKGLMAIFWSLVGLIIYIALRFEFSFGLGAVISVLHDVVITVGVYCLLGNQLSMPVLAAVLTIIGFSVNDTIVIFDRMRENLKLHKDKSFVEIANLSINQCLGRTLLTTLTAVLTVVALLVFGGGSIRDFALVLLIGMITGVFSTMYIATPVVMFFHRGAQQRKKAA